MPMCQKFPESSASFICPQLLINTNLVNCPLLQALIGWQGASGKVLTNAVLL